MYNLILCSMADQISSKGVHHSAALHLALPSAPTEVSAFASLNKEFLAPADTLHSIIKTADGAVGVRLRHPVTPRAS